jgi:hypothetical protein
MSIVRVYNHLEPNTYWSVSISVQSTVLEVCEDLAAKILPDDEIFLMFEVQQSKGRSGKVKGTLC